MNPTINSDVNTGNLSDYLHTADIVSAYTDLEDMQRIFTKYRYIYSERITRSNEIAILSLGKQIPKEVVKDGDSRYSCPNCRSNVASGSNYCRNCGQRLDWVSV